MRTACLNLLIGVTALTMSAQEARQVASDTIEGKEIVLDEVLVSSLRVTREIPLTFSNLEKKDFESRNLGQDIPILMNFLPGVVTTSDAGAGVGYTGIRVRGSDATRVNVTINGVPYNDAESQGTFWVNMPDFASSVENLQLQRGVGTSTNGAGAFGASLNLLTDAVSARAGGQVASSFGSFNTLRNNVKFSSGLMGGHVEIAGRLSRITSDGYVDRAASSLDSYFLQGSYVDGHRLLKGLLFGGHEITYQSWFGVDAATLATDRTYNPAGQYTDENGAIRFYENEVDDYKQDHAQLLWNEQVSDRLSTNVAFHYTHGRGFFEQYREDDALADYGIATATINGDSVSTTDLVRRRWLDNDFYGMVFSATYEDRGLRFVAGGGYNRYEGSHFGEIIWARYAGNSNPRDRYYDDDSRKSDFNLYAKTTYKLNGHWSLYGDLQFRVVGYSANGQDTGLVDDTFHFFNPKAGLTYSLDQNHDLYFSYARAHREPNRNDYENGSPEPEKLNDFELGWRFISEDFRINTNVYYMQYKDQLVLTGALNDVGAPLRSNSGDSYRLGIEMDALVPIGRKWQWRPNLALSTNRNVDYYFRRDGELRNLGNTRIAYSPGLVVGNVIYWEPIGGMHLGLLSKYVGKQYMGNIDSEASVLDAYSQTDLSVSYELEVNTWLRQVVFSGLVNNIFDARFESNGYFYTYDDDFSNPGTITTIEGAGYYPQAGINFLLGVSFKF